MLFLLQVDAGRIHVLAQHAQVLRRRRGHLAHTRDRIKGKSRLGPHGLDRDPGHELRDPEGAGHRIVFQDREIRHHHHAKLGRQPGPAPAAGTIQEARARDVVAPLREAAPLVAGDDEEAAASPALARLRA